jgi:hypothetical protein
MVEIDPETCREWLHRYAHHGRLVMLYLWHELYDVPRKLDSGVR